MKLSICRNRFTNKVRIGRTRKLLDRAEIVQLEEDTKTIALLGIEKR
jgi:hypothetical protein